MKSNLFCSDLYVLQFYPFELEDHILFYSCSTSMDHVARASISPQIIWMWHELHLCGAEDSLWCEMFSNTSNSDI